MCAIFSIATIFILLYFLFAAYVRGIIYGKILLRDS